MGRDARLPGKPVPPCAAGHRGPLPRAPSRGGGPPRRVGRLPRRARRQQTPDARTSPDPSRHGCSPTSRFPSWTSISLATIAAGSRGECSHREAAANRGLKGGHLAAESGCVHSHPDSAATEVPAGCVSPVCPPSERKPWRRTTEVSAHIGKRPPSAGGGRPAGGRSLGRAPSCGPGDGPWWGSGPRERSRGEFAARGRAVRFSMSPLPAQVPWGHGIPPAALPKKCSRGASAAIIHILM